MKDFVQVSISEEKHFDGLVFPMTLSPGEKSFESVEDVIQSLKENMTEILNKLVKHGAILLRGFPVNTPSDFNEVALAFGWKDLPYIGGAGLIF